MQLATPTRPVLRWHGGKWKLAPWIISQLRTHRIYVEPFGGAGSVLVRKPRSYAEVYNDLDGEVVNLFRVLRDKAHADELCRVLLLTPFAREEFLESYEPSSDSLEQARRLVIRCFMGFGSNSHNSVQRSGFRSNSNRSGSTPAHDWANWPLCMGAIVERLRGVVIENRKATEVIAHHDSPETLFYVDPPYPWHTRQGIGAGRKNHAYRHEMTDEQHRELANSLHQVEGMVVISGYPCEMYDAELYPEWNRCERKAYADGARERIEVLWMNDAAANALQGNPSLFALEQQLRTKG